MDQTLSGINHLVENDIVEILREHFGRFGYGFKKVKFSVDLVERDKPRFEIDVMLDYIGKRQGRKKRVDILYDELMSLCKSDIKAKQATLEQLYVWVRSDHIDEDEFIELIDKIKGL